MRKFLIVVAVSMVSTLSHANVLVCSKDTQYLLTVNTDKENWWIEGSPNPSEEIVVIGPKKYSFGINNGGAVLILDKNERTGRIMIDLDGDIVKGKCSYIPNRLG